MAKSLKEDEHATFQRWSGSIEESLSNYLKQTVLVDTAERIGLAKVIEVDEREKERSEMASRISTGTCGAHQKFAYCSTHACMQKVLQRQLFNGFHVTIQQLEFVHRFLVSFA